LYLIRVGDRELQNRFAPVRMDEGEKDFQSYGAITVSVSVA
jgi:hypothetical protein